MKRLLAIAILAACGVGAAHGQTYFQLSDACRNAQQDPAARVKSCDAAFAQAQPDAKADRALILLNRADANLAQKKYDAAIADADASSKIMDRYLETENMRCWIRAVANRDLEAGRAACEEAKGIRPGEASVLDTSGTLALQEGDWQRAMGDFHQAYTKDKSLVSSVYGRGLARIALGHDAAVTAADLAAGAKAKADFDGYGLTQDSIRQRAAATPKPAAN